MRQPLWLINSSLLVFFICTWLGVLLLEETPVSPARIMPEKPAATPEQEPPKVSIARIYENDLFGTYTPQPKPEVKKPEIQTQPPQPPQPQPAPQITRKEPSFLDPLAVTLKGIIFTNHEEETRAIIADNASQEETLYSVGDGVKDADIVYIGKDKVILMRSNGQQETLFLTQKEAQDSPGYPTHTTQWSNIITQLGENAYRVDPQAFAQAVPHLAYFIDELDMTTAFENGKAYGVRIGAIGSDSIGAALGLQPDDIITEIDGIAPTTPQQRVTIYQKILTDRTEGPVQVTLVRDGQTYTQTYYVQEKQPVQQKQKPATLPTQNPMRNKEHMNRSIMAQGNKQKQTVDALQQPQTNAAMQRGGEESALTRKQQKE